MALEEQILEWSRTRPLWQRVVLSRVAAAHVQRRVHEQYGERETVSRAARRVLRSFLDWGVLQETESKGIYTVMLRKPTTKGGAP